MAVPSSVIVELVRRGGTAIGMAGLDSARSGTSENLGGGGAAWFDFANLHHGIWHKFKLGLAR